MVEFGSHFKTIILIVLIIAEQVSKFIPGASPRRQTSRETKCLCEAGGIAIGKIKTKKHSSFQLNVVNKPVAHIGITGAPSLPVAFFDKCCVLKVWCQDFPNPESVLARAKRRRRTPGTPINSDIALKETWQKTILSLNSASVPRHGRRVKSLSWARSQMTICLPHGMALSVLFREEDSKQEQILQVGAFIGLPSLRAFHSALI